MATNLSQGVADLARQIAQDQIAQDIAFNAKLNKFNEAVTRLIALESKVRELIAKGWFQESVSDLSYSIPSDTDVDLITARIDTLEQKITELQAKAWVQEPLS